MTVWTDNIPASGDTLAFDQPLMVANNTYLATTIAVDHSFAKNTGTAANGYHKVVHYVNQTMDPTTIGGVGQLYTKTVGADQQLFYKSGGGVVTQFTGAVSSSAAQSGYTNLPGGLLLQWGIANTVSNPTTVTFPVAFSNTPYEIVANTSDQARGVTTTSYTTTNFVANVQNPTAGVFIRYFAIGPN